MAGSVQDKKNAIKHTEDVYSSKSVVKYCKKKYKLSREELLLADIFLKKADRSKGLNGAIKIIVTDINRYYDLEINDSDVRIVFQKLENTNCFKLKGKYIYTLDEDGNGQNIINHYDGFVKYFANEEKLYKKQKRDKYKKYVYNALRWGLKEILKPFLAYIGRLAILIPFLLLLKKWGFIEWLILLFKNSP